ncbi:MAG: 4-(cytidine 5'-diphospho)-2-C-methyl-D-erythritol kinase [Lachnospiraceae bacterium]|nr:4-(cytidine 5'-diphospho)-2-C-methyl-D-erythritol kinase [Lachnospiraceae bacterium]
MGKLQRKAYAKVNLGLDVIRRREDGYHEVKMIMQTVDLYDVLTFEKTNKPGIRIQMADGDEKGIFLPLNEHNLIYKAAKMLFDQYNIQEGLEVTLEKNIPIAAGMAGGSTDAAAAFLGVRDLFDLKISMEELKAMAVKVGADVPYCLEGGTQLSEGIGEKLTILPPAPDCYLVIAKPGISVSTKYVYQNLHCDTLKKHPDIDGMVKAITDNSLKGVTDRMENVLETVTIPKNPVIRQIKQLLLEEGAENALMSGSGPTTFGIFKERETAETAFEAVRKAGLAKQLFVTTLHHGMIERG